MQVHDYSLWRNLCTAIQTELILRLDGTNKACCRRSRLGGLSTNISVDQSSFNGGGIRKKEVNGS